MFRFLLITIITLFLCGCNITITSTETEMLDSVKTTHTDLCAEDSSSASSAQSVFLYDVEKLDYESSALGSRNITLVDNKLFIYESVIDSKQQKQTPVLYCYTDTETSAEITTLPTNDEIPTYVYPLSDGRYLYFLRDNQNAFMQLRVEDGSIVSETVLPDALSNLNNVNIYISEVDHFRIFLWCRDELYCYDETFTPSVYATEFLFDSLYACGNDIYLLGNKSDSLYRFDLKNNSILPCTIIDNGSVYDFCYTSDGYESCQYKRTN